MKLLAGGTVGAAFAGIDAFLVEPSLLSITRKNIICPGLPTALDGLRVGLLADFHFCPGDDDDLLDKVVSAMAKEKPDLITLGGDYMNGDPSVLTPLLEGLGKLSASKGVFAVMGNHDGWATSASSVKRQFERSGISFLLNRNSLLSIGGEKIAIAGTDHIWKGRPDPSATLKGISAKTPVIALVHEPDYFDTMTARRDILLQVSGHTHGGQCRVPFLGFTPATVKYGKKYVYGEFKRDDSRLFVTRGIGMSGIRARFSCLPELAILTLRSAAV